MAILMGESVEQDRIRVQSICYTTDIPLDETWYQVNEVPEYPQVEVGKKADMYFIPSTKEFVFEITDRPLTPDEEKDKKIAELQGLLDDATALLIETGAL